MKLNKKDQKELNEVTTEFHALECALKSVALLLGKAELSMWKKVREITDGQKIRLIKHPVGSNASIVLEEE